MPGGVSRKLTTANRLAQRAATVTDLKKATRWIKKSRASLRGLQKTISHLRGRRLSVACADQLAGAVADALVHTERWLAAPSLR